MAIIKSTSTRRTSTIKSTASKSTSTKTATSKSTSSKSSGTLNSNGYRDNFDYSAAIAGTTDSAKRQQLLSERQNKIDSLGLGGKVASNDAVSTWNGTYRPYSVSSTTTGANRVSSLYDAAENARFKRFETARSRIAKQLESNLVSIENDYAAGMRQTDINARQSAVNNEEKLAALGLNMGARGQATTSGIIDVNGEKIPALRGNRLSDGAPLTVYPGEVPARLPGQAFWDKQGFQFEAFRPQVMDVDKPLPHIRLDAALEFLIGDKLR